MIEKLYLPVLGLELVSIAMFAAEYLAEGSIMAAIAGGTASAAPSIWTVASRCTAFMLSPERLMQSGG